ncbi:iron-hydroxamate ABC transporter substrate-binding protein [Paenibacillus doosanensis]|uniref:Iron(3+)-hydroxamate-binding protein FhuD n=1 Tax=Paenibacillus konkukensis TaxID=2020716 RepID=A0ABY4RM08_9BACL|nr:MULTISPECIES: iron-hydroxamate ABC transporter substrate-binding protein [Paenibacillus]MCS7463653.1 iron-hydroxamate ABC transporter substrate-binding protein [Paenibacillus doosanensis]UQZ83178.1 Iron(3+)-hydroxamate-binding protein FhuD precursor [Paenibacillus konkukensis]
MKNKLLIPMILLLMVVSSACGSQAGNPESAPSQDGSASAADSKESGKITYQSERGPVEVPASPKRIVALTNAPNVLALEGTLVGVDQWTKMNPLFTKKLDGVEVVSEADLEKITAQDPDLIIAGAQMKNIAELNKIAPTVVYTWGKLDYLEQQLEIGKLLNKEKEAQAWVDDFKQRAGATGKEIKAKLGDNVTVSVFETDAKSFYVFGDKWARGTEILYQAMGLNMPDPVKKEALGPGYYMLSKEVLPEYAGDYIVLSRDPEGDASFMESEIWKGIPAVKNHHVIEINTKASSYSDPITLEYLLGIFKKGFLE